MDKTSRKKYHFPLTTSSHLERFSTAHLNHHSNIQTFLFSNTQFMEINGSTPAGLDELEIIKAAAWAWYLRGSGCERKASHDFYISRRGRAAGPSRYKLEAMRDAGGSGRIRPEPCTNVAEMSLVNSHEVDIISMKLGCVLGSTGSPYDRRRNSSAAEDDAARRRKVRKLNGFWLRHAIGMCSSRRDIVETRTKGQRM